MILFSFVCINYEIYSNKQPQIGIDNTCVFHMPVRRSHICGATHDIEKIRIRGRWKQVMTARHYVQDWAARFLQVDTPDNIVGRSQEDQRSKNVKVKSWYKESSRLWFVRRHGSLLRCAITPSIHKHYLQSNTILHLNTSSELCS